MTNTLKGSLAVNIIRKSMGKNV